MRQQHSRSSYGSNVDHNVLQSWHATMYKFVISMVHCSLGMQQFAMQQFKKTTFFELGVYRGFLFRYVVMFELFELFSFVPTTKLANGSRSTFISVYGFHLRFWMPQFLPQYKLMYWQLVAHFFLYSRCFFSATSGKWDISHRLWLCCRFLELARVKVFYVSPKNQTLAQSLAAHILAQFLQIWPLDIGILL